MKQLIVRFQARFYRLLEQAAPRTLLEVGCGEGFLMNYVAMQDRTLELCGADISFGAVEYAYQHRISDMSFLVASGYELPFPANSFDLVICSEVLEHLQNVELAVSELQRVGKRYALISVPWEPYFRFFTALAITLGCGQEPGHIQFWSARAFDELVARSFLRVLRIERSFPYQMALCELT